MKQAESEPACYCTLESILKAVGSQSADSKVINFLRSNKLFEEREADYSASLLILKCSEQWRIRADLNASPQIEHLPQIQRTGRSSPWMRCYMLGLKGDVVTDPDLQRARCLFLSSEAAIQEWIDLLVRIFKLIQLGAPITAAEFQEIGKDTHSENTGWFGELRKLILWYVNQRGEVKEHELRDKVLGFLRGRLGSDWNDKQPSRHYVEKCLHDLSRHSDFNVFDRHLLSNLVVTLMLALGKDSFDSRHLGPERLGRIKDRPKAYNLVVQGAGDLSMNEWNVAYYSEQRKEPKVVIPENEPFGSRRYNCLVVWNEGAPSDRVGKATKHITEEEAGASLGRDLSITQLQFSKGPPYLMLSGNYSANTSLHELVKFAVYGKLVLRQGNVVEADEVIDEFQDLRHVFLMPNLNPRNENRLLEQTIERIRAWTKLWIDKQDQSNAKQHRLIEDLARLLNDETQEAKGPMEIASEFLQRSVLEGDEEELRNAFQAPHATLDPMSRFLMEHFLELRNLLQRPRHLFGQLQRSDVWLLEHALLHDRSLRHLACTSAIAVDLADLGAPRVWIDYCLLQSGYRKRDELHEVQEPGDFAWDESDHPRLLIRLKLNTYPCTIVGIGRLPAEQQGQPEMNALYLLAWGHDFRRGKHTIWDCAEVLRKVGAQYALVIDEGQDVFLCSIPGNLWEKAADFESQEKSCGSLREWMCVPLAFNKVKSDNGSSLDKLNRRGLRASLAFWQEDTGDLDDQSSSPEEKRG
jgi:hypothetical protein